MFADYLKSKAEGYVPDKNIRLLVNENATYSAIYDALNWLLETCHKDDLVYFYFSGHGDMENNTIYKLGFLLSYNTPRINYINNAVRIEDVDVLTAEPREHEATLLVDDGQLGVGNRREKQRRRLMRTDANPATPQSDRRQTSRHRASSARRDAPRADPRRPNRSRSWTACGPPMTTASQPSRT